MGKICYRNTWNLKHFTKCDIEFGHQDISEILQQLSKDNRLMLPLILRGDVVHKHLVYNRVSDGILFIWLTNDERREIIKSLDPNNPYATCMRLWKEKIEGAEKEIQKLTAP